MANQRRRRMQLPTILSRDLLNLALVLAFLHLDPDAYLGISRTGNHLNQNMYSNKILDDLSALGHYTNPSSNQFNFDQPQEISAYILNAETPAFQDILSTNSAVNIHNNQSQQFSTNNNNSNETIGDSAVEDQNNIILDQTWEIKIISSWIKLPMLL